MIMKSLEIAESWIEIYFSSASWLVPALRLPCLSLSLRGMLPFTIILFHERKRRLLSEFFNGGHHGRTSPVLLSEEYCKLVGSSLSAF